jgi:hypothetical protein
MGMMITSLQIVHTLVLIRFQRSFAVVPGGGDGFFYLALLAIHDDKEGENGDARCEPMRC